MALRICILALLLTLLVRTAAQAAFGVLIPSRAYILHPGDQKITFTIGFVDPMRQTSLPSEAPQRFVVAREGEKSELTNTLTEAPLFGNKAWRTTHTLDKPGVYAFGFESKPVYDGNVDAFSVHYSKVYVPAFGEEEGWDTLLGFPIEIRPLTRPFGNYAGMVFQGQVLVNGRASPYCDIEIEFYNSDKTVVPPNPYFATAVLRTDPNGVFTFVAPWEGWWAIGAFAESTQKIPYQNTLKELEMGGILWVPFGRSVQ